MLTAGRTVSDKLWQTDIIIIKYIKYLTTQWKMTKQPSHTITTAIIIIFTEGKEQIRNEQVLICMG